MKTTWQYYAIALLGVILGGAVGRNLFGVALLPAVGTVGLAVVVGAIFWFGSTRYLKIP
jgi:hypothetical protein